jgi:RHS repeat-associated protein
VYFDNLQVGKVNGNILEENHYYSFGLRISAISSRRFTDQYQGETKNGYLYQGAFAELDDDIGWQDFALRSYDAQIGRFMQMDPFSQFASHYTGMGNDPVNMIDPSGGIGIPCPGTSSLSIFFSTVGEGLMNIASSFSSGSSLIKLGVTAAHAGANVYRSVTQFNTVNNMMSVSLTSAVGSNTAIGRRFPIMLAESRKNGSGSGPDWDRNPDASGIRTDDLVGLTDEQLINEFRFTMNLYTRGVLDDVGNRIVDHFAQNTGKDFTDEILNNQIEASSAYQEKVKPLLANIQSEITRVKGDFLKYNKQVFNLPNFPTLSLNNSLKAIVGGTQYGNIILTKFTYDSKSGKFSGEINITIIDDFGVSKSDILKAKDTPFSKGLRAMWYLQHVRGYKPFRTVFSRNFRMTF